MTKSEKPKPISPKESKASVKAPVTIDQKDVRESKSATKKAHSPTGVSAPAAAFLSLLVVLTVLSGLLAFRDLWLPYWNKLENTQDYSQMAAKDSLAVSTFNSSENTTDQVILSSASEVDAETKPVSRSPFPFTTSIAHLEENIAKTGKLTREEINNLRDNYSKLEAEIKSLKTAQKEAKANSSAATNQANPAREAQLNSALANITLLEAQVTELSSQLQNMTQNQSKHQESQGDGIRSLIAFQSLESKAMSGKPFQPELQRVIALLGVNISDEAETAVTQLEAIATVGRPNLSMLQRSYKTALTKHLQSAEPSDDSLAGKIKSNLSSFVRVRRVDGEGEAVDSAISNAEKALQAGNVKQAIDKLNGLPPKQIQAFSQWLLHANAHVKTSTALQELQMQLTQYFYNNKSASIAN